MNCFPFQTTYQQGWVCPKCGSVYAPFQPECWRCAPKKSVDSTTENTTDTIKLVPTPDGDGYMIGEKVFYFPCQKCGSSCGGHDSEEEF